VDTISNISVRSTGVDFKYISSFSDLRGISDRRKKMRGQANGGRLSIAKGELDLRYDLMGNVKHRC